ncbi:hypothetical protein ACIBQ1_38200 [Nonomuraea sp. NPDC050153]|uniref:hypothetical protein n=1 Tax=Nonomuraea sp. NPDC050153 TaxID=3364359 RepID=UPI0037AF462D
MSAVTEEIITRATAYAMLDLDPEQTTRITAAVQAGVTACGRCHGADLGACLACLESSVRESLTSLGFEVDAYESWRMATVIQDRI